MRRCGWARRYRHRKAPQSGYRVSAPPLVSSSPGPSQPHRDRQPLDALASSEAAGLELIGRKSVEVIAKREHQVPVAQQRRAIIHSGAGQKPGGATLKEDPLIVCGPVTNQAHAGAPKELPRPRSLQIEEERTGAQGAQVGLNVELGAVVSRTGEAGLQPGSVRRGDRQGGAEGYGRGETRPHLDLLNQTHPPHTFAPRHSPPP